MADEGTHVVSMCHMEHLQVWRLTSELLPHFVKADRYTVYVPQEDTSIFAESTHPLVEVRSQKELDTGYAESLRRELSLSGNTARYGWYLQQFLKFEALKQSDARKRVIWDADCVPVRPITLFDDDGAPVYMRANEFHEEYFNLISRWIGMRRVQDQSFVIPGFPILGNWVSEFFDYVQQLQPGLAWHESLIENIDFGQGSGFSETETLGTYIANMHPKEWSSKEIHWERLGQTRFGNVSEMTRERLIEIGIENNLDIVSFENWDQPGLRSVMRKIRNAFSGN